MTREEAIAILDGFKHNPLFNEQHFEALDMAIAALSENRGEPTDEEVIRYCNKRGYVICTQAFLIDYLKREQRGIQFEGYVGINGAEFARLLECKRGE